MPVNPVAGLFWDATPPPKPPPAEKIKRTPPPAVWRNELPGLEEAIQFPIEIMDYEELYQASVRREELILDVEVFENYFLAMFYHVEKGKVYFFEEDDLEGLEWVLNNCLTIGFNSLNYDLTVCALAIAGFDTKDIKEASDLLILQNANPSDVLRLHGVKKIKTDHVDLIEVAPLYGSLKIYAGRLHAHRMQDLPFDPHIRLSPAQKAIVRWYCVNDCRNTLVLRQSLKGELDLRVQISNEFKIDLRSKSDAQIAEAVINHEIQRITGRYPRRPKIDIGTSYKYQTPYFLQFKSPLLQYALQVIQNANFVVDHTGSIAMPEEIKLLKLDINGSVYRMGIGGLHSSEQTKAYIEDDETEYIDGDVTSYYPRIILNLELYPAHLGRDFLSVFRPIVNRRVEAKLAGNKVVADSLKIVVNGSFGKFGNMFSILYSPNLLFQVTITGQLSLLMLIEMMEFAGIHVVSANTDGFVARVPKYLKETYKRVIKEWEFLTGFEMETGKYKALYSRDVNNYIAIKENGKIKGKGAYANPETPSDQLHKNPTATISLNAVQLELTKGIPIETTIRECTDIRKFVSVRNVRGGAVTLKGDNVIYVGQAIRWYYAKGDQGEMVYAKTGNRVPKSEGAKPCMILPDEFPDDVDHEWYIKEAHRIMKDIGAAAA